MTKTDAEFQSALGEKIDELVALSAYAYANDDRVTQAYVFVGLEDSGVYRPYFNVGGTICSLLTLDESLGRPTRPDAEQFDIQHVGLVLARELMELFVSSDRECPYELKIVHDCGAGSVAFELNYDKPTVPGSTRGSAAVWLKALCAGEDPLPRGAGEEASSRT